MNQSGEKFLLFNKAKIFFIFLLFAESVSAQLSGTAGTFSRIGFGARGMGMGNALSSVKIGEIPVYYNAAFASLQKERIVSLSYGMLTLDRHHNVLLYSQPLDTNAGFAIGVINSGVTKIDGRDNDGFHTENYSTSENQFSFAFALRIKKFSFGLNSKIYYYSLFEKLSAINFGADFGVLYQLSDRITIAATVKDLLSKYKWDTSGLYEELGNSTAEKFPLLKTLGISYLLPNNSGLFSAEIQSSNQRTTIARVGAEYNVVEQFTIRGGIDGWDVKEGKKLHPSFGFSTKFSSYMFEPSLHYAMVIEPYGVFTMHIISISATL